MELTGDAAAPPAASAPSLPKSVCRKTGALKIPAGYRHDLLLLALWWLVGWAAWALGWRLMVSRPAIDLFGPHDVLYLGVLSTLLLATLFAPVTVVLIHHYGTGWLRRALARAASFGAIYAAACLLLFAGAIVRAGWPAAVALIAAGIAGALAVMVLSGVRNARRIALPAPSSR